MPVDSKTCPTCRLDFEQWAFLVPKIVVFGSLILVAFIAVVSPWIWKVSPWLHDKGTVTEGKLMSDVDAQPMVPLFIHWKTGERYIVISAEQSGGGGSTDYMNNLVPLPPQVVFHYDIPVGEKVWIIGRQRGSDDNEWVRIGRWISSGKPWKYGWVHASSVEAMGRAD